VRKYTRLRETVFMGARLGPARRLVYPLNGHVTTNWR